ncbi:MAG: glycosyltransferase [Marinilabiliaceae bacterium]|nr:glycosyltransferase [Marinilabiliaceae bacterium]
MKFIKISTYYRDFLKNYYTRFPEVVQWNYAKQYAHLMEQYFSWSDNYGRLMAQKGMETMEIVSNAVPMQRAWAIENGFSDKLSLDEIVAKQIEFFKPEVVYFQYSISFRDGFIREIRKNNPSIRLIIGNICAPFANSQLEQFKVFDYFTVCSPVFVDALRKYGFKSILIPHAFDGRLLDKINIENHYSLSEFFFTGSIIPGEGFHSLRLQILENLVNENIPFDFYGNLPDNSYLSLLKKRTSYFTAQFLDSVGLKSVTDSIPLIRKGRAHQSIPKRMKISKKLYSVAKPPIFGLEMFKALSKAKIGFNIHGDCAADYTANMRIFETTGVATCLLTDMKKDLNNYFDIDNEIVTYSSVNECIEKIKWLLNNPNKCREIAQNGQLRTLRKHNFESRVDMFLEKLTTIMKKESI